MGELVGWCGNVLLLAGSWLTGTKWRHAPALVVAGDLVWAAYGFWLGLPSLWGMCLLFTVIAARNWWLWNK